MFSNLTEGRFVKGLNFRDDLKAEIGTNKNNKFFRYGRNTVNTQRSQTLIRNEIYSIIGSPTVYIFKATGISHNSKKDLY